MIERRKFLFTLLQVLAGSSFAGPALAQVLTSNSNSKSRVALVKTSDRQEGIKRVIEILGINPVRGQNILLKPNFNSSDPFPASTHPDTIRHLVQKLRIMGATGISIGERSGPEGTKTVLLEKGLFELCRELEVKLINFDNLPKTDWVNIQPRNSHWKKGFMFARPLLDADRIVITCCLKTHRYGGVFTMSLKLAVGMTHRKNMRELHTSFLDMRKMIAEINQAFEPALILLDGIEAFVDGGPARGRKKTANVLLAGTDRIAIDAVGLAILKELGSNRAIMGRKIFKQEQIARAVELNLGVSRPEEIEIITTDKNSKTYAHKLTDIIMQG